MKPRKTLAVWQYAVVQDAWAGDTSGGWIVRFWRALARLALRRLFVREAGKWVTP